MRGFGAVFTLDDLDDAAPLMRRLLGWQRTRLPVENAARGRREYFVLDEMSAAERRLLEEMNAADAALYRQAREQFRADLVVL